MAQMSRKFKNNQFLLLVCNQTMLLPLRGQHCHIYVPSNSIKRLQTQSDRCFLDAFAELRKTTIRFVMYVCLSVCSYGTTRLPLDGFWL